MASAKDSIIPEFNEKIDRTGVMRKWLMNTTTVDRQFTGVSMANNSKITITGQKTSTGTQTARLKSLENYSIFETEEAEELDSR